MQALPLVLVALTCRPFEAFERLPSCRECYAQWNSAKAFEADLLKWTELDPDRYWPIYMEQQRLRVIWGDMADAMDVSRYNLCERLGYAHRAREAWNWQLYGLPPVWTYWRLPYAP